MQNKRVSRYIQGIKWGSKVSSSPHESLWGHATHLLSLFMLPVDSPADPQAIPWGCSTWLTVTLHHCSWGFQCLLGTPSNSLAFQFHCLLSYNDLTFPPPQLPSLLYTMSLHTTALLPLAQYQASHSLSSICYPGSLSLVPQLQQFIESIHVFIVPPHPSLNSTTHHYYSLHCTCSNLPYIQPWLISNPTLHLHLSHRHPSHWVGEHIIMLISHTSNWWLQTPNGTLLLPDMHIIFP